MSGEKIHEYVKKNTAVFIICVIINVAALAIGYFIGGLIGTLIGAVLAALSWYLTPKASKTIKEITRF